MIVIITLTYFALVWLVYFRLKLLSFNLANKVGVALAGVTIVFGLLLALTVSALYALYPAAPGKIVAGLAIGLVKVALIGFVFMRLNKASPLIRLTAGAGALWLLLLFVFLFSDYLTRPV